MLRVLKILRGLGSRALVIGVLLLSGCTPDGSDAESGAAVPSPYRAVAIPSPLDSVALFFPQSLHPLSDERLLIADMNEGHVVSLGMKGEARRVWGRKGEGPGELKRPVFAVGTDQLIAVSDAGNGKVVVFDRQTSRLEREIRIRPRNMKSSFAIGPRGEIVTVDADSGLHIVTGDPSAQQSTLSSDFVLSSPAGPVVVREDGSLVGYNWDGSQTFDHALPGSIRRAAQEVIEAALKEGMDLMGAPLIKAANVAEDGRIVAMLVGRPDGVLGFVLEPGTGRFQPIVRDDGMTPDDLESIETSVGVALHADTLVVLDRYGIQLYELHAQS